MRRFIQFSLFAVAVTAAAAPVNETLTVSVVEVPVTVVDGSGNPVRGLTAANFKLLDNGKEREIMSFDTIDFASNESMQAVSPMNPAARRNFLLLFDLSFSNPANLARAQEAARNFVTKAAQARDLVGVGTVDNQHGFRLLTAFTTDRQLVTDAIAHPGSDLKSTDPLHLGNEGNSAEMTDHSSISGRGNGGLGDDNLASLLASAQKQNRETVRAQVEKQMDYLGGLAKTLRTVSGRKQVIFLSEGFDPRFVQGRDARDSWVGDSEAAVHGAQGNVDSDARFGSTGTMTVLQSMAKFFRGSDVVLHALDIQGVRVQNDVNEGATVNSNAGLNLLAEPTGGMVFKNANKIEDDFGRMMRSQEVVYVLSFRAPAVKAGQFHNLSVKLVNVPGSARPFSRAGYYEAGTETQQERTLSNAEIITNDIPQEDVRVAALAAPFPGPSGKSQVPVVLEIDGADLLKDVKGNAAAMEVYLYAFDAADGSVRDRLYQKMSLDLKKVADKLRGSGIKYLATLSLPPGSYAVKALVRVVETDRKGYVRSELVVPKSGEMAVLPPIFVDEDPKWLMVKGTTHAPDAAYPFDLNGEQFVPATAAHVHEGGKRRFAVFVQNPPAEELTFDANQKIKFLGAAKGNGGTAFVMELDKIDPKLATLDVTVHRKGVAGGQKTSVAIGQ
jgi:VWFA-related protein